MHIALTADLNRGSTLLASGRQAEALADMERAVVGSKGDKLALLGRGGAYHALGRWGEAAADYGAVVKKSPADVQPFWLRYALELYEVGQRQEALGIARRLSAKFDIEPECTLAVCSLLWRDGADAGREEALRRYRLAPLTTKQRMAAIDPASKEWTPTGVIAAREFLSAVGTVSSEPS